ncbi:hypothetical protein [Allonocardiopsis opalescens]|uniref:Uncharacterized protein n=1 Tax=Allonocardiopsis opalescens TaxID=1144618 RepID=A0A2T0QFB1_9ACTN|nr:hypothetical protein [Allonocardiopsis opalescens]PRY02602.1 hypothetical protein CLV72_1011205 [Allonocardiopsis opalescens]
MSRPEPHLPLWNPGAPSPVRSNGTAAPSTGRLRSPDAVRYAHVSDRIPSSLDALRGPADGVVRPPLRLAWSGMRSFDVGRPGIRVGLYQLVITEGLAEDYITYLNAGHLVADWPVLRRAFGPVFRTPWEERFPELRLAVPHD